MKTPDLPQNEQERLSTLQSLTILDSAPDERFDRLTRIAIKLFDVPVALVSIVDKNRQWFKSCQGIDITETPRELSFCGHAILGDGAFVVEDTHKDERFIDNPLLIGQKHIRFYSLHRPPAHERAPSRLSRGNVDIHRPKGGRHYFSS